ncbi:MAG: GDP-mannose 4,6-dehydratase [Arenicella sp.]
MSKKIVITGGAGFIGVNSAQYFSNQGWQVVIVDNLSRGGTDLNLQWLIAEGETQKYPYPVIFEQLDIRDGQAIASLMQQQQPDVVLHLAAQVAVTTSVNDPREDFDINALGSFNVLEAIRLHSPDSFFINASTNKVYGKMDDLNVVERNGRYEYDDLVAGVAETRGLDFHSPYGCSKGVADQYTIDYARVYGLRTVTLRQSCIYGPRQFGIEDQGWVAWFTIAALLEKNITIYGDGKQIRDVLHVHDLVNAYAAAIDNQTQAAGQAINIGGGADNTLSLLELIAQLEQQLDIRIPLIWDDWRPGDQPVFVCNLQKAKNLLNWQPQLSVSAGLTQLIDWVKPNADLFKQLKL